MGLAPPGRGNQLHLRPRFTEAVSANPRLYAAPETLLGYVADQPLEFPAGSNRQLSPSLDDAVLRGVFRALRRAQGLAVCPALRG